MSAFPTVWRTMYVADAAVIKVCAPIAVAGREARVQMFGMLIVAWVHRK